MTYLEMPITPYNGTNPSCACPACRASERFRAQDKSVAW